MYSAKDIQVGLFQKCGHWGFPDGSDGKESVCNAGDPSSIPGLGRSPGGEGMATHSNILAWRIPRTEEPGGLWGRKESDTTEWLTLSLHTFHFTSGLSKMQALTVRPVSRAIRRATIG